ncbi:minichromosome maintenance protein 5 [Cymbomonas tetramitiformis]|uniref:DNA replication licensing factor MCM5 n=1 Tax=Cymbomonas tetramitiformis TaxID=36881 RepID=A0AAE0EQE5_9CHLO|nr:minichromosome maintenance protein 5 [Cymbomonas tetramitiformis]|eukprot:gene9580-11346_t
MSGWDEGDVFFSNQSAALDDFEEDPSQISRHGALRKFIDFLRNFREHSADANTIYRDALDHEPPPAFLKVSYDDLHRYDNDLAIALRKNPADFMPLLETAASEVIASLRQKNEEEDQTVKFAVQILLSSSEHPKSIRALQSDDISKLVVIPGIVIAASRAKSKATYVTLMCKQCKNTKVVPCKAGFGGAMMPRTCDARAGSLGEEPCPLDPFTVLPERSQFVDQQTLKLQENPEDVPTGELPRNMILSVDRNLVQQIVPGTRVSVVGIYSIFQQQNRKGAGKAAIAIRQPYIRVIGLEENADGNARGDASFSAKEEAEFEAFAARPTALKDLRAMIGPSIFGSDDIKAAIACLLFGGARKKLPDGARLRGDVNVLMLGDPSTAKSQFLKFVSKVAPIAVYTSGKGSSAAGLTASIIRDSQTGEAYLEGGAMVLADGGVVCIDEFDKMRPEDRVAIHEAMEQQTISIAKAGITTVLNSRTAVLAAANPPSGRYDDMKTAAENIDLQTTILSRFDLIFIVKDERNWEKDMKLAKHVIGIHRTATVNRSSTTDSRQPAEEPKENEIDLKRYIAYCKRRCAAPVLSEPATERLQQEYVRIRAEQRERAHQRSSTEGANPVPITVRQLEALVRISESLAKMCLLPEATEEHVHEAMRLFNISTIDAAKAGISEGLLSEEQRNELVHIEKQIQRLVPIQGSLSERVLVDMVCKTGVHESAVRRALMGMQQRGEMEFLQERKKVFRKV